MPIQDWRVSAAQALYLQCFRLLPASQGCRHDAGAAPPVHHCHNPQRLFLRRVGYHVVTNNGEPQGPRGELRASVALMRKQHKAANGAQYVLADMASRRRIVFCDKFSNLGDVLRGEGVKVKALFGGHSGERFLSN